MIYYINLKLIQYYNKLTLFLSITLIFLLLLPLLLLLLSFCYQIYHCKVNTKFDHLSLAKCDLVGKFQLYFIANSLNNVIITIHITIEI